MSRSGDWVEALRAARSWRGARRTPPRPQLGDSPGTDADARTSHRCRRIVFDNLTQLLTRLNNYSKLEVAIELTLIWLVVWIVVRFLRDTGGAGIIKGLALLLIVGTIFVRILAQNGESFQRLNFLYDKALGFAAIGVLVIFQPELRRALIRLGEATFFRTSRSELAPMIEALVQACEFNSKNRIGLLVAIVRRVGLSGIVEGGTALNADVSAPLLQTIFWPNSALHDLGVVIEGRKVLAASAQFPLTKRTDVDARLGSRHRAALGVTEESDCLAVVVSEETGGISVAERGQLNRMESVDHLRRFLAERLLTEAGADGRLAEVSGFSDEAPKQEETRLEAASAAGGEAKAVDR
ncbi:MAG: diadenylate cyclase CdaA [Phycisphaerales bacterium]|nr:diadenylate cyclase CdaA [Phycisphaerales bacterium]